MDLVKLLFFALACHTVAHTFTVMSIFKPVRQWANHRLGSFWGDLLTCPYCFGHHVAWVTVILFNPFDINTNPVLNFFVSWFSLTGATNFLTYILEERIKRPKKEKIIRYKFERENHKIEM
jgi:hypothetical protein